ncbi:YdcF family protein [Micavibrio aeruginosavorus]|uniref:YdcF family protein n=1 Tax=Micavibrio aeruginosavorus TaxID=349221 RepID=UPI003F4AE13A
MSHYTPSSVPVRLMKLAGYSLAAAFWLWISGYLLFLASVSLTRPHDPDRATDAIIVLTGGQNRIHTGLELLEQGKAEYLFISGVNPDVSIMQIVRQWKPDITPIPCCIVLGHAAANTEENAHESSQWVRGMNIHSVRLVTSTYHLPRAWLEFNHALPRHEILAHPIKSPVLEDGSRDFLKLGFSEYNKTLMTWVRQNIFDIDLWRAQKNKKEQQQ